MDMDKKLLLIDLKVEIGLLEQAMQESEKSFANTQQAHNGLMSKLSANIKKLQAVATTREQL